MKKKFCLLLRLTAICSCFCVPGFSAAWPVTSDDSESFHVEITGSAWLVDSGGTIQAGGSPVDLVSDLGAQQQQPAFYGRLVIKPGRRHRIVVEGMPLRLNGYNIVSRTITYQGQTFDVNDTVRSTADLNYAFAGYQYDLLSSSRGHFGLSAGAAYLSATGTVMEVAGGTTATKTEAVGLPLAGAEGRVFPLPHSQILQIEAGVRGMAVGSYGHYLEASGSGGVGIGPFVILAGYRWANIDLHDSSAENGVDVRLHGPIFSLQWRK
jgi:hypothetical protein